MAAERLSRGKQTHFSHAHNNLVKDCKAGDRKAQYRLYILYNKAMFNTCLRMLKNKEDAEDVLQNSFIQIFSKLNMFREESTIGAWIKRIVINNCINFIKKRRLLFSDVDDTYIQNLPESNPKEEIVLDTKSIQEAIYALPEGYRIVFSLYALEGYDHSEIAEIMGTSVSTSKSQYSRAKKRIREILKNK